MQTLWTKKITEPLGGKKNRAPSRDKKKPRILSGQKNALFWDNKNHATSRDNKKSCNLLGQKEIMQPLGKKKSHATPKDKKK